MNLYYKNIHSNQQINQTNFTITWIITSLGPRIFTGQNISSDRMYQNDRETQNTIRAIQKHPLNGTNRNIQPITNRIKDKTFN